MCAASVRPSPSFALLGSWPQAATVLLFAVFWILQSGWPPLSDALIVNALGERGHRYGRIRSLASLSFAISVVAAGVVLTDVVGSLLFGALGGSAVFALGALAAVAGRVVGWFAFPRRVLPSEVPSGDAIMAGT